MNRRRIVIPVGMLKAAMDCRLTLPAQDEPWPEGMVWQILEAAFGWVIENPIVPDNERAADLDKWAHKNGYEDMNGWQDHAAIIGEWQRRMLLTSELENT